MTGDPDRVFELASVTKLLTARAVLVAVEEGVCDLSTPVGSATVAHFLAHAAGVGFATREYERAPETRRIYSSSGYEVLADFVEKETEIPFSDYLHEAVCQPLGMTNTELYGSAGHGARSTLRDMDVFAQEMMDPRLVADPHYEVWYPELNGIVLGYGMFKPCPWALGPEVKGCKGLSASSGGQGREHWMGSVLPPETVGHFGQSGTFLWAVPGEHYAVVLTDRSFGDWAKPLWSEWNDAQARSMGYNHMSNNG